MDKFLKGFMWVLAITLIIGLPLWGVYALLVAPIFEIIAAVGTTALTVGFVLISAVKMFFGTLILWIVYRISRAITGAIKAGGAFFTEIADYIRDEMKKN